MYHIKFEYYTFCIVASENMMNLPSIYPRPVSTSGHDKTLSTFVGKIDISMEIIAVQAPTSATPSKNLKENFL